MKASFPHHLVEGQVRAGAPGSYATHLAVLALFAPFVLCTLSAACTILGIAPCPLDLELVLQHKMSSPLDVEGVSGCLIITNQSREFTDGGAELVVDGIEVATELFYADFGLFDIARPIVA